MTKPEIVSREQWLSARKALLAEEKELVRQRDALAAKRRALPMVRVDKPYVFEGPEGKLSLRDLFGGRSQMIIYHFMLGPDAEVGCKSCSLLADTFDGASRHLPARDISFVVVSRAQLPNIQRFQNRMGWTFRWLSSFESDFNFDYGVSFREGDTEATYNYAPSTFGPGEAPGLSVFLRDGDDVFHTYSTYARGLDPLIATYSFIDLTPLGRNEQDLPYGMAWVRHHDSY